MVGGVSFKANRVTRERERRKEIERNTYLKNGYRETMHSTFGEMTPN